MEKPVGLRGETYQFIGAGVFHALCSLFNRLFLFPTDPLRPYTLIRRYSPGYRTSKRSTLQTTALQIGRPLLYSRTRYIIHRMPYISVLSNLGEARTATDRVTRFQSVSQHFVVMQGHSYSLALVRCFQWLATRCLSNRS